MTELLEYIRDRIEMSEGPQKCFKDGVFTHQLRSTYPRWWQSRGYSRQQVLSAINKALKGQRHSEVQDAILGRIVEAAYPEYAHYVEINSVPMSVEVF